ncbi:MAG: MerR family transcriptional regulator [Solibacillus sp.]
MTVWGDNFGIEKLKIGELATASGVTKRTIDYYTNIGLLSVERSVTNYRYYDQAMIERIHWIEAQKRRGKCLEEIHMLLSPTASIHEEIDVQEIRLQMRKLEKDVAMLMEQLDDNEKQKLKKKVSLESAALMQSLILILNN